MEKERVKNQQMKATKEDIKRWTEKGLKVVGVGFGMNENNPAPAGATTGIEKLVAPKKKMNKTEQAYANLLELYKRSGDVFHYGFEELTLKLGNDTRYTPDFFVVKYNGMNDRPPQIEFHEVKGGFIRDDSRVKFQCARKQFPFFKFKMMQYVKGEWNEIYLE